MKHKLTVLACVGLALLLSTGFAFAQNTVTVASGNADRCATIQVNVQLDNADAVGAIGLPLVVTGGTLTGVAPGAAIAGWTAAINQSGNQVLVNAIHGGASCLAAGSHSILTLTIETSADCQGDITVDLDGAPAVPAAFILGGCDCCELPSTFVPGALTLVNNPPICGVNSDVNLHFSGEIVDKTLNASDPDACDALSFSLVSGPGSITGDKYNWDPGCPDVGDHTVTFRVTDDCGDFVDCSFDITVYQNAPVCSSVPAQTVHWNDHLSVPLPATDDGCPNPLTWTLDDNGGLGGTLSVAGGTLNYDPVCGDVPGTYTVAYTVSDGVLDCSETVDITVTNTAPTIVCPDPIDPAHLCDGQWIDGGDGIFSLGEVVEGDAVGDDVDGDALSYSVVSVKVDGNPYVPVNAPAIDGSGHFSWQSDGNDAQGMYEFCIEVSDGCASATCCFEVEMDLNFYISIRDESGTVDTIPTLNGEQKCVYVNIQPGLDLGGFDLLLCYDQSTLAFLGNATPLGDLVDWEYFTYRAGANSNCSGGGCPSGLIRLIAIADLDNGPTMHPPDASFGLEGNIVELCFQVTGDRNFIGQCLPIDFCTYDCGDNVLSSKDGTISYLQHGSDPECLVGQKTTPIEEITLCGGAICVREPKDGRGDINLNFIANEVGDAVLYSRYFIEGIDVFSSDAGNRAVQIQASDVNNDGIVLTVADLIYLIRIITGDEQPFPDDNGNPKVAPYANSADALVDIQSNNLIVTTNANVDLGGAYLVFRYSDVTLGQATTTKATEQMVVRSRADKGELRVLITPSMESASTIKSGSNQIVSIPFEGNGTIELVEAQLADGHGQLLSSNLAKIQPPKSYALLQNYPNPFNAGTVIRFDLKDASDWDLTVYNITGQVVRTFSGHNEASQVSVQWDGKDNSGQSAASGVYFYRVNAGDYTAVKKMTLLK